MLSHEQRRVALAMFPAGIPVVVIAPARAEFAPLVAARNEAMTRLLDLHAVDAGSDVLDLDAENVLLEGLDDLDEPEAFLARLQPRVPRARLFTLVANGAHLLALGSFYAGVPLAAGHPLVRGDIEPLFAAGSWKVLAVKPLLDESLPPAEALPFRAGFGGIVMEISDPAMLARSRDAGFLVIADPA